MKARGERNGWAKLTAEKVLSIRTRYAAGERQAALAASFVVSLYTIRAVVQRKGWKHLGGPDRIPHRKPPHAPRSGHFDVGEKHPLAVLTATAVQAMRSMYSKGDISQRELAQRFFVSQARIQMILANRAWTHL